MPTRLSKIDELTRPDHSFLTAEDECYFLGEYTARAGFTFSRTNDIIQNLKKPMDRRDRPEWRYKEWAITESIRMLREALPQEWIAQVTFVPIPPSKTKDHPEYDDRLLRILSGVGGTNRVDVRELVVRSESIEPAHLSDDPRSAADLARKLAINEEVSAPMPAAICVFDDVLTTGASFRAVQGIISARFPAVPIAGLFLARRASEASLI